MWSHSDTDLAPDGGGTFASRTAVLGGECRDDRRRQGHCQGAARSRRMLMEAAEDDIEFVDGTFPRGRHRP